MVFLVFLGLTAPIKKKSKLIALNHEFALGFSKPKKPKKNNLNMCNSELSNQKNQKNHLNMCIRIGIIDFFIRNAHIFANPLMLHETVLARFCSLLNVCIQKPKLPVQKLKKHKKKNIFLIILTCSLAIGGRPTFLSGLAETWFVPSTEKQPLRFHWNLCPQAPFCLEIIMQGPFCLGMKMQGPFCTRFHGFVNLYDPYEMYT